MFDTHCHLQDKRLAPHIDEAMQKAATAGVSACMCCGTQETDWDGVRRLSTRYPGIRISFGLHPWYVTTRTSNWMEALESLLTKYPSGVGEIGLDHALDEHTFAAQEEVFVAQLSLATRLGRPVSAHCRRAWGRMMELLDDHGWPPSGIVFHAYSGGPELVAQLVRRGAFFSFAGTITSDKNVRGREAVAAVPEDRLLAETDAPDMPPVLPEESSWRHLLHHQKINEPANLVHVVATIDRLRGWPDGQAAAVTARNAETFFAACRP